MGQDSDLLSCRRRRRTDRKCDEGGIDRSLSLNLQLWIAISVAVTVSVSVSVSVDLALASLSISLALRFASVLFLSVSSPCARNVGHNFKICALTLVRTKAATKALQRLYSEEASSPDSTAQQKALEMGPENVQRRGEASCYARTWKLSAVAGLEQRERERE
jgi:hypothetical protein